MRTRPSHGCRQAKCLVLANCLLGALPTQAFAQSVPTNFTANKDIVLATKTPLGEATVTLPSATAITNCEVQGDRVKIWQGPFTAIVALADVQAAATPTPTPAPSATPAPQATPVAATIPEPEMSPAPDDLPAGAAVTWPEAPDWLIPAAGGALVAYAVLTTIALLRTRRRRGKPHAAATNRNAKDTPVIALPTQSKAKPAVMAEGGRAIACPLCGKDIPLEKISKGRNLCPSCQGAFVGE